MFSNLQVSGVGYNGCGHVAIAGQTLTPNSNLSVTKVIEVRSAQCLCIFVVFVSATVTTWPLPGFKLTMLVAGWLSMQQCTHSRWLTVWPANRRCPHSCRTQGNNEIDFCMTRHHTPRDTG